MLKQKFKKYNYNFYKSINLYIIYKISKKGISMSHDFKMYNLY